MVERDIGEINGDRKRYDLGNEHKIPCTDDVLWSCTPEIYII